MGLTSVELALVRSERLTATERAVLHTGRAQALVKLGQVQDAASAVITEVTIHHGHFVAEARDRLSTAVSSQGEESARSRAMDQIKLASLVMVTGDPAEAAVIGRQALDAMTTIRSKRVADAIRDLRRFAPSHERTTGVADLLHHISATALT